MADQWDEKARPIAQRINGGGKPPPAGSIKAGREAWLADVVAAELRSAYEQGKRDERDRCAQVAEKAANAYGNARDEAYNDGARAAAAAIRSRSTNDASE